MSTGSVTATAGTVANDVDAGVSWVADGASLQADVATSDDSRVTATVPSGTTKRLLCTNFSFALPNRAEVVGVQVDIERSLAAGGDGVGEDETVRLIISGTLTGDNKAVAGAWPTTDATATYGGNGDMWGLTGDQLDRAEVNGTTFGVGIEGDMPGASDGDVLRIDHVTLTVFYILKSVTMISVVLGELR